MSDMAPHESVPPHGTSSPDQLVTDPVEPPGTAGLVRIQNGISYTAGALSGIALVTMVVIMCIEVFSRLLLGQPLGWNVAFTEQYLLLGGAFFGIVYAYQTGAHVAVTSIFAKLPHAAQKNLQVATHALVTAIFGLLFWYGLQATLSAAELGDIPPTGATELPIPEWIWRSFIPLGSGMGLIIAVINLYREIRAPWSDIATDDGQDEFSVEADQ